MGFQPVAQIEKNVEPRVEILTKELKEEYQASILLHLALLLSLSVIFAFNRLEQKIFPEVYSVRLIGPFSSPKPGSGDVLLPNPGSSMNKGVFQKPLNGDQKKFPTSRRKVVTKPKRKITSENSPQTELESKLELEKVSFNSGFLSENANNSKIQKPEKPYFANLPDDTIGISMEPNLYSPISTPSEISNSEKPLEAILPPEEFYEEVETETISSANSNSGLPLETVSPTDRGEFEIAALESLGGTAQRFEPPRILTKVLPEYPEWARKKGINGQATYKILIYDSGTVGDVITMSSTTDLKLALIGGQALRRWVFSPVFIGGEPKETWVLITMQFKLD